ncbi:MAG: hypothetical protein OEW75_17520, partial [Cyclobacteriaceae bacterium]|nr:hypothetical protein [Cyclobacteriaceae bacterium]
MIREILFVFFLIFNINLFGQVFDSCRFEVDYKYGDHEFNVVNMKNDGLILFRKEKRFFEGRQKPWQIIVLDTFLNKKNEITIHAEFEYHLLGYEYKKGFFFMLFSDGYFSDSNYYIYKINLETAESEIHSITNEIELDLSHFLIIENQVILGGKIKNRPTIVHFDLNTDMIQVLPGFYRDDTDLVNLKENKNGSFNVLFLEKEHGTRANILNLKVFNSQGTLLMESTSKLPEEYRVLSGNTNKLEYSDLIVSGTYSERNNKLSQGLYYINMRPGDENPVKFIPYTNLSNFFSHLGERRESRIKEKIRQSTTEKPFEFKTSFVVWEINETPEHYEIFGEVIDPQYDPSYNQRVANRNYGNPYYNDPRNFESLSRYYQTTHSLLNNDYLVSIKFRGANLIVINKEGSFENDYSMTIKEKDKTIMEKVSSYYYSNNGAHFFYKDEEEIFHAFRDS